MIFWRSWICWTTSDKVFSTWYTSCRLPHLGHALATQNAANWAMQISDWVAEQTLHCPSKKVGLNIICPKDLGGHISHGPSSLWALREFQLLEGTRDARRAAGYPCQIRGADYKRPIEVLSTCAPLRNRMSMGWPLLERVQDKFVCKGPLPLRCYCGREHTPLIGVSDSDSSPPMLLVSVPSFGNFASMTTHWKVDSSLLGMAISLISLLRAFLRSSLLHWLRVPCRYALSTKHGRLVRLRGRFWQTSPLLALFLHILLLCPRRPLPRRLVLV